MICFLSVYLVGKIEVKKIEKVNSLVYFKLFQSKMSQFLDRFSQVLIILLGLNHNFLTLSAVLFKEKSLHN